MTTLLKKLNLLIPLIVLGILIGILALTFDFLLLKIQHITFGYALESLHAHESYLDGVKNASPARKLLALFICGLIAGFGWYWLARLGKKLLSVKMVMDNQQAKMSPSATLINALLQVITIGMGSPLGKEGAPREVGALLARRISIYWPMSADFSRLFVAAGASAAFSALYNIPVTGVIFALEVLLKRITAKIVVVLVIVSAIAVLIVRLRLGNFHPYEIVVISQFNWAFLIFSLLFGPLFAVAAHYFIVVIEQAKSQAKPGKLTVCYSVINFTLLGAMLIVLPELAGNGQSAAYVSFMMTISPVYAGLLLVAKVCFEVSSFRVGAQGGLMTPSFANGALLAVIIGHLINYYLPGFPLNSFAIIGAATFLAIANKMPLTALVMTLEMAHLNVIFALPIALSIAGGWFTYRYFLQDSRLSAH